MRAMAVHRPAPIETGPLSMIDLPRPEPGPGEILVRVHACGVCRTDLHVAEGDLPPKHSPIVPGHEVVGVVSDWATAATASYAARASVSHGCVRPVAPASIAV